MRDDERSRRDRSRGDEARDFARRPVESSFLDYDSDRDDYHDDTDRGYDEAARSGGSRYGMGEGRGGVFGTTGGGAYDGGFQIIERPGLYDRSGARGAYDPADEGRGSHRYGRDAGRFDTVGYEPPNESHRGRGPKNYKRSDQRILEDVGEMLTRHGEIDASDVELSVNEGVVSLSGTVEHRRIKRLIEDLIDHIAGVTDVQNQLKIR